MARFRCSAELTPKTSRIILLRLVSKSCAALSASSLENFSSVSSSHSLSEAVFLASLSFLRLVCSEHIYTPFSSFLDIGKFNAQIDNNHYISSEGGLSRGLGDFFSFF